MNTKVKNILLSICAGVLLTYLLVVMVVAPSLRDETHCTAVSISVSDQRKHSYVRADELSRYLLDHYGTLQGTLVDSVSLFRVEETLREHPMLRSANAYFTPEGRLTIAVTQRQPVLRVMMEGETYFVDSDRERMPVATTTATYVPIVTGRVPTRMATGEIFDFVTMVEDDDFWSAQIEQINVVSPTYVELVPRVGSGIIILGDLNDCSRKLKKLKKLYQDGFSAFGWNDYREIDLRFRGQVVCRK